MKKEQMVGARLPEGLVRDLELVEGVEQADRSTTVRKLLSRAVADWKRAHFARQYADGRMTMARAAKEAGVTLWEMMDYLRQQKVAVQYDLEDLEHDMRVIRQETAKAKGGRR